ncbi:exosortase-dependent surface protein XDP1 [Alteromonas halophila]|uniref:PEP-CTERM sorting domain-containing protein n=1 Tax=Alteromonas halophila TaxID=516698 RepID=A0A918JKN3_9ALTE|nr:exosortase-dependent surface protein XDP1 [Alteromonas halophila]GGW85624.1 hypothetical protein GCM10007391_19010 [Alteromonas halophila]
MTLLTFRRVATVLLLSGAAANANASWNHYKHCGDDGGEDSSCQSALAEATYDLIDNTITSNSSDLNLNGMSVDVSAWSDTAGYNDDIVTQAHLNRISSKWGYGVLNNDWEYDHNIPDHAIDNVNQYYYNVKDFDFVLFSFSEATTLTNANFTYTYNSRDTQVSVAALDSLDGLMSGSQRWDEIVAGALSAGSFDVENCDTGYQASFDLGSQAQYWLVGAYNTVFGDIGGRMYNDAFKLASVGFKAGNNGDSSPSAQVSEPATLGLLLAGGLLAGWRKKQGEKTHQKK